MAQRLRYSNPADTVTVWVIVPWDDRGRVPPYALHFTGSGDWFFHLRGEEVADEDVVPGAGG
jgi:hypothetical protein